jgi:hypothetical protein
VFEMMKALNAQGLQEHVNAYESGFSFAKRINHSTWIRG